jgi:hypothetical protein
MGPFSLSLASVSLFVKETVATYLPIHPSYTVPPRRTAPRAQTHPATASLLACLQLAYTLIH